jgi:CBS domain-containing protein
VSGQGALPMSVGVRRAEDVMRTDVPSVTPDATLREVLEIAWQRGVRHLLVVDGRAVVGIISDRDIKRALTADREIARGQGTTAGDIMTRTVITVSPDTTVKCACDTMMQEAISALPVMEHGALKGILTETDVLALFAHHA